MALQRRIHGEHHWDACGPEGSRPRQFRLFAGRTAQRDEQLCASARAKTSGAFIESKLESCCTRGRIRDSCTQPLEEEAREPRSVVGADAWKQEHPSDKIHTKQRRKPFLAPPHSTDRLEGRAPALGNTHHPKRIDARHPPRGRSTRTASEKKQTRRAGIGPRHDPTLPCQHGNRQEPQENSGRARGRDNPH